jgi:hypothetical protein
MTTLPALVLLGLLGAAPIPAQTATPTPAVPAASIPAATPEPRDPWAPLRPLLGDWVGEPAGRSVEPVASLASFDLELGGALLVRRHRAEMPPLAGETSGAVHEDLLVIWPEEGAWRATYWDNEGHVIQYRVKAGPASVTFDSEPGPGPRFRLEYRIRVDGGQAITFSVAPPGAELKVYLSGGAHRRGAR